MLPLYVLELLAYANVFVIFLKGFRYFAPNVAVAKPRMTKRLRLQQEFNSKMLQNLQIINLHKGFDKILLTISLIRLEKQQAFSI